MDASSNEHPPLSPVPDYDDDASRRLLSPATSTVSSATTATAAAAPTPTPPSPSPSPAVYCVCRGPDDGSLMVECGGCGEWFHADCCGLLPQAPAPSSSSSPDQQPPAAAAAVAAETAPAPAPATEAASLTLTIPDDWRCPVCCPAAYPQLPPARGAVRGGGRGGRKREREGDEEEDGMDSEAEAEAVEVEVGALLREQGVGEGEDEELAGCLRREVERRRALARRLSPLEALPDALLQHITGLLPVLPDLLSLASAAPGISVARGAFWRGLAQHYGLSTTATTTPRSGSSSAPAPLPRRRTRRVARSLRTCARRAFFRAYSARADKERVLCDDGLSRAYALFCKPHDGGGDSVAETKRILAQTEAAMTLRPASSVLEHRHTLLEGNTVLNLAARCGCLKVMKFLVGKRGADMRTEDVGGFTPLLNAVWRDDPLVVRFFLGRPECTLAHLLHKGTSRRQGPYDAVEWAEVRGHTELAALLRRRVQELRAKETAEAQQQHQQPMVAAAAPVQAEGLDGAGEQQQQQQQHHDVAAAAAAAAAVDGGMEEGEKGPSPSPLPPPAMPWAAASAAAPAAAAWSTPQTPWRVGGEGGHVHPMGTMGVPGAAAAGAVPPTGWLHG